MLPLPDLTIREVFSRGTVGLRARRDGGHANPHEVRAHAVLYDVAETRTSDLDRVHREYTVAHEECAVHEQTAELGEIGEAISQMWKDVDERSTPAGTIVKGRGKDNFHKCSYRRQTVGR